MGLEEEKDLTIHLDSLWEPDLVCESDKCECGAEKTYGEGATHSDWCPKSRKEKK